MCEGVSSSVDRTIGCLASKGIVFVHVVARHRLVGYRSTHVGTILLDYKRLIVISRRSLNFYQVRRVRLRQLIPDRIELSQCPKVFAISALFLVGNHTFVSLHLIELQ